MNKLLGFIKALRRTIEETWFISAHRLAQGNLIDVISAQCGWQPLDVDQTMIVHFDGKEYFVQRNK